MTVDAFGDRMKSYESKEAYSNEKYLTMDELNKLPNDIRETLYNIPVKRTVYKKYSKLLTFALLKELLHED